MAKKSGAKKSGAPSGKVINDLIGALNDAINCGYLAGYGAEEDFTKLGRCLNELASRGDAYRKAHAEVFKEAQKMLVKVQKAKPKSKSKK